MKQSILEVIKSRHSVRTYSNNPIDESIIEYIQLISIVLQIHSTRKFKLNF